MKNRRRFLRLCGKLNVLMPDEASTPPADTQAPLSEPVSARSLNLPAAGGGGSTPEPVQTPTPTETPTQAEVSEPAPEPAPESAASTPAPEPTPDIRARLRRDTAAADASQPQPDYGRNPSNWRSSLRTRKFRQRNGRDWTKSWRLSRGKALLR